MGGSTWVRGAGATLLVLAVSTVAFIGWWISARAEKRRQRDMQLALQDNG